MKSELNTILCSVQGMANLLGITDKKFRTLASNLQDLGLIVIDAQRSVKTNYKLTDKGKQYVNFESGGVKDFSEILYVLRTPNAWTFLNVLRTMEE